VAAGNGRVFDGHVVFAGAASFGLDAQKKRWSYQERDEVARAEFVKALPEVAQCDRVYVDESGCDDRLQREHGWSPRGVPCLDTCVGHATERLSVVAAWQPQSQSQSQSGLVAALSFDGTCHSRLFELWLRVMLCPVLRAGQGVILDNARFHRKKAVQRILKKVGCRALFLPAYSPDLNLIEPQWHRLKTRVRTNRLHGMTFKLALEAALL
jgi:hypothetical protein